MHHIKSVFLICSIIFVSNVVSTDSDEELDIVGLIRSRGFQAESHSVTTKDGYILGIYRIINPLVKAKHRTVLLQHGLLLTGNSFLINSPGPEPVNRTIDDLINVPTYVSSQNNLGFVLANLGFDVWIGNSRGNTYSTNHTTLDHKKDKRYWEFSYDEMIKYDSPAVIQYILSATGRSDIGYVGHSQGSLMMFGLLSTHPEYNNIIKPFIALAPVTRVKHMISPIKYIADNPLIMTYFKYKGGPFLPANKLINFLADTVCKSIAKPLCENIIFLLCGFDETQLNTTRLPVYFRNAPAGTSTWNLIHYGQNYLSGLFSMYDYGKRRNNKIYGIEMPPIYDISKITSKHIALLYSDNDWLADPQDIGFLLSSLRGEYILQLISILINPCCVI